MSMAQTIGGVCALAGVREEREAYAPQRTGARSVARFIQQPWTPKVTECIQSTCMPLPAADFLVCM